MEKEKQSYSIVFVYRDNDLFKEMMPQVVKTLESLGHEVKIQSFPAGTEWEKMEEQINKNKVITSEELMSGARLITDGTTRGILNDSKIVQGVFQILEEEDRLEDKDDAFKGYKGGYLDRLFDKATASMLLGEDYVKSKEDVSVGYDGERSRGEESLELGEKSFKAVIERILENENNHPHKIYIALPEINGHLPFRDKLEKDEAAELLQKWTKDALEKAKVDAECLIAHDFDFSANRRGDISTIEKMNQEGNWVIANRHSAPYFKWSEDKRGGRNISDPKRKAKLLQLPVPSMLKSAIDEGLISFSKEEKEKLNNIFADIVEEDFGEEQKKE